MAERRMFAKRIIESASFLKMPISSRELYFHLCLNADDDGVVEAYNVMNLVKATEDDLRVLMSKGYVQVLNPDLVTYISNWLEHNKLRPDRKIDSIYKDLLLQILPNVQLLEKKERADRKKKKVSEVASNDRDAHGTSQGQTEDINGTAQYSVVEDSIGKDSIDKSSIMSGNEAENGNSDVKTIIEYLNLKAKKSFRATTKLYERHINARLSEGYTLEDFKHVIDVKCAEWMNTDHEQYLRPDTLFAPSHFDSYLNQKIVKAKPKSAIYFSNDECREQMKNETPTF